MNSLLYLDREEREVFWRKAPPWVKEKMVSFLAKGFVLGFVVGAIVSLYFVL